MKYTTDIKTLKLMKTIFDLGVGTYIDLPIISLSHNVAFYIKDTIVFILSVRHVMSEKELLFSTLRKLDI